MEERGDSGELDPSPSETVEESGPLEPGADDPSPPVRRPAAGRVPPACADSGTELRERVRVWTRLRGRIEANQAAQPASPPSDEPPEAERATGR